MGCNNASCCPIRAGCLGAAEAIVDLGVRGRGCLDRAVRARRARGPRPSTLPGFFFAGGCALSTRSWALAASGSGRRGRARGAEREEGREKKELRGPRAGGGSAALGPATCALVEDAPRPVLGSQRAAAAGDGVRATDASAPPWRPRDCQCQRTSDAHSPGAHGVPAAGRQLEPEEGTQRSDPLGQDKCESGRHNAQSGTYAGRRRWKNRVVSYRCASRKIDPRMEIGVD